MPRRIRRTYKVENTWTCSSCGLEVQGRFTHCGSVDGLQGCGSPKEADEKDRIDASAEVQDEALLAQAAEAPHEICEYCGTTLREIDRTCPNCAGGAHSATEPSPEEPPPPPPAPPPPPPLAATRARPARRRRPLLAAGCLAVVAAIAGGLWWFLAPTDVSARVESRTWRYTTVIEERTTKHGSGWRSEARSGALNFSSCDSRFKEHYRCNPHDCNPHQVGYQCNPHDCNCTTRTECSDDGTGFSTCVDVETCQTCYETCYRTEYDTCWDSCDRYEEWCEYDWHEWPQVARAATSGGDDEVHWPDLAPTHELQRMQRSEEYKVTFRRQGEGVDLSIEPGSLDEFRRYRRGERWLVRTNRSGRVSPLRPD